MPRVPISTEACRARRSGSLECGGEPKEAQAEPTFSARWIAPSFLSFGRCAPNRGEFPGNTALSGIEELYTVCSMQAPAVIRQPRLRDQVYAALRDMLRAGTFPPEGAYENDLAIQLNVSRTPVREALFQLCREGMLEDVGRGYRIPELSADDMREIIEMRLMIEPQATAIAVARTDDPGIDALALEVEAEAKAHSAGDVIAFVDANNRFRAKLLEMSQNRRIMQVLAVLDDQVQRLRWRTLNVAANRQITLDRHQAIVEAFRSRNAEAAANAMRDILVAAGRYYEKSV